MKFQPITEEIHKALIEAIKDTCNGVNVRFAKRIGVDGSTVGLWISKERQNIREATWNKLRIILKPYLKQEKLIESYIEEFERQPKSSPEAIKAQIDEQQRIIRGRTVLVPDDLGITEAQEYLDFLNWNKAERIALRKKIEDASPPSMECLEGAGGHEAEVDETKAG